MNATYRSMFTGTRTRFQRLKDAKLFSGWVRVFREDRLVVTVTRGSKALAGEQFAFQVFGHSATAQFTATVTASVGDEISFSINGDFQLVKSTEKVRILTEGLNGALIINEQEFAVRIADLGQGGAGIMSTMPMEKGESTTLRIDYGQGPITCNGIVRYCRATDDMIFRIGLSLTPHNRVDVARWQRLLAEAA